ncbi:hypothetical protein Tco_0971327, partial [Tanacetum coccineum]
AHWLANHGCEQEEGLLMFDSAPPNLGSILLEDLKGVAWHRSIIADLFKFIELEAAILGHLSGLCFLLFLICVAAKSYAPPGFSYNQLAIMEQKKEDERMLFLQAAATIYAPPGFSYNQLTIMEQKKADERMLKLADDHKAAATIYAPSGFSYNQLAMEQKKEDERMLKLADRGRCTIKNKP